MQPPTLQSAGSALTPPLLHLRPDLKDFPSRLRSS